MQKKPSILFIGFGDIGQRTATLLAGDFALTGFKRSPKLTNPIQADTCKITLGDFHKAEDIQQLLNHRFDVIVLTLTPKEISDTGYRQSYYDTVQRILDALQYSPELLLFASSTSVYGQSKSEWVDEDSPTEPTSFSGKQLLNTEQLLQNSGLPYSIVRFSGIYGPGRKRLIEQVQQGKGSPTEPPLYSNRIHADDAAGVLAHLIRRHYEKKTLEHIYLASDSHPTPLHEVKEWLAGQMSLPEGRLKAEPVGRSLRGNKRCKNEGVLASGYAFLYPTFQQGYQTLLQEYGLLRQKP